MHVTSAPIRVFDVADVTNKAARWLAVALFIAVLLVPSARADWVTLEEAELAVVGWLHRNGMPLDAPLGDQLVEVVEYVNELNEPVCYVFYLDPNGYIIVSADDLVEPIIAFAPFGEFDPSPDNPLGALISSDLVGRLEAVRGGMEFGGGEGDPTHVALNRWNDLIEEGANPVEQQSGSIADVRVAPLLETTWGQSTYCGDMFNYYTPSNYVCGCVATAMAQLMKFHEHPTTGVGTGSFSITVDGNVQTANLLGGDENGGAYDWANMQLTPTCSANTAQRKAVGALSFDAGISVNMSYTSTASGTDTLKSAYAFTNTFGYNNAIPGRKADWTNIGAALDEMINPNLDAGYPVVLGITGAGGHAIVCDGYGYDGSTLYHHLNLGWWGDSDAWYALPTIDTNHGTFTSVYKCVYNVFPTESGEIVSGRVLDDNGDPISGVTVTAVRSAGGSYNTTTDANGIYAFLGLPASSEYTLSTTSGGLEFDDLVVTTGTSTANTDTCGNYWGADLGGTASAVPAELSAPTDGATLSSDTVTFNWSAGSGATAYGLVGGSGVGSSRYFAANNLTDTSVEISGLPTDGSTLYVRLWTQFNNTTAYKDYTFTTYSGAGDKAEMLSPTPGSTISGYTPTFTWSAGNGADLYAIWVGDAAGGWNHAEVVTASTNAQLDELPTDGRTLYLRLWTRLGGTLWVYNDYQYTAFSGALTAATMNSPADGATLTGSSVTFNWDAGSGCTSYAIQVGSGVGNERYYASGAVAGTSDTATGIPCDGSTIYVRLWSLLGGEWDYNDYTYTAFSGAGASAELTSPANASTLTDFSTTLNWTAGSGVTQYAVYFGSGVGKWDYFFNLTGSTSMTIHSLPTDGRTLYCRIWSQISGEWVFNDYTFTAYTGTRAKAEMTSPADSTTLPSGSETFTWSAGAGCTQYSLQVGSGIGSGRYFNSGITTDTSADVTTLPVDGTPVYARLWSFMGGVWVYSDFQYYAHSDGGATPSQGSMLTPTPGSTLAGPAVTFTWEPGFGVWEYYLDCGTGVSDSSYFSQSAGMNTSIDVTGLPTDSSTVYVRLWSLVGSDWESTLYTYSAADMPGPEAGFVTSPLSGTVVNGGTLDLEWDPGNFVDSFWIQLGTSPGGDDIFSADVGTVTSYSVPGIPTDGTRIYLQFWSFVDGNWEFENLWYDTGP